MLCPCIRKMNKAKYMAKQVLRGDAGVGATDNNPFLQPAKGTEAGAGGPNPFEMMSYNAVVPDEVSERSESYS